MSEVTTGQMLEWLLDYFNCPPENECETCSGNMLRAIRSRLSALPKFAEGDAKPNPRVSWEELIALVEKAALQRKDEYSPEYCHWFSPRDVVFILREAGVTVEGEPDGK